MKRKNFAVLMCASTLVASAAFGQDQPEPFSPVTGVTTTPGTATIATATRNDVVGGSVVLKVDGSRVVDMTGQPIGRIDNIVMSPVGCAEAAILTSANGRLIPIPWSLVRVSDMQPAGIATTMVPGANLVFTVNTDQARLAAAPSFTRTQFGIMTTNLQPSMAFFGVGGAAGVGATGAGSTTVTGGATNTDARFGTTATGGTNQSRFGATATTVPTNSSTTTVVPPNNTVVPPNNGTVLPPTGRQPNTPQNQPAPSVPPTTPPPGVQPTTPPPSVPPTTPPPGAGASQTQPRTPPANPATP